tara:strand:+ start:65 stop:1264 length:1200 start_codon:yes stop_codon:yes gene_type:complete
MTPRRLGLIVEELSPDDVVNISRDMNVSDLSEVLDETSPDVAADVLREMPGELRAEALSAMKGATGVLPLIDYEDDDAGGLMTPRYIALNETMTVRKAIEYIRSTSTEIDISEVTYILVVDPQNVLKGGLNVSQLVTAENEDYIADVMYPNVISVSAETDQEECALIMERYNLLTLPVVDERGRLEGIVKIEDMIYVLQEEATEDMYRMVGVAEEEKILGPFWDSVKGRLPWLCVNLVTAGLAALVITLFQSTLGQVIALAAFLPVIAGQGGIVGTQTLTLVVRSMALGEISPANAKQLLLKEFGLGLVHGCVLGILAGLIVLMWHGNEYLALVVGVAMLANLCVAGVSGVVLPLSLKAAKLDPALSSAVVVTTITDVVGFLIYLGLASAAISLIASSF